LVNPDCFEIIREADGSLKVKIRAQPVEGKANKYLLEYLAKVLGLPKSSLSLLKGESNSFKTVEIDATEQSVLNILNAVIK
jgi:hypothetical protein